MQAGTLEGLARPALVACCKRLGVWTKGKAVAQMKEALGGAFALALAQHREAQQRGAAGAAALERLAAAAAAAPAARAPAAAPAARARRAPARVEPLDPLYMLYTFPY